MPTTLGLRFTSYGRSGAAERTPGPSSTKASKDFPPRSTGGRRARWPKSKTKDIVVSQILATLLSQNFEYHSIIK